MLSLFGCVNIGVGVRRILSVRCCEHPEPVHVATRRQLATGDSTGGDNGRCSDPVSFELVYSEPAILKCCRSYFCGEIVRAWRTRWRGVSVVGSPQNVKWHATLVLATNKRAKQRENASTSRHQQHRTRRMSQADLQIIDNQPVPDSHVLMWYNSR